MIDNLNIINGAIDKLIEWKNKTVLLMVISQVEYQKLKLQQKKKLMVIKLNLELLIDSKLT
jgi:hypothetical protein